MSSQDAWGNQRAAIFYYAASLLLLFLIPWAKEHWHETNLPPLLPEVRTVINLLYLNLAAAFFILVRSHAGRPSLRAPWWVMFAGIAAVLCVIHPVFSGDLMEYLIRGRILGVYHQSPYQHVPAEFPNDILYAHSTWKNNPDSYGPLSVLLQTVPAVLWGNSLKGMVWLEKLLFAGSMAGGIYFFARMVREFGSPGTDGGTLVLFALNPLLWVSTVIDGHNDAVMLSLTIAAVYFLLKEKFSTAFLLWTAAFLVKYTVVLVLPFMLVTALRSVKKRIGSFPWKFAAEEVLVNAALIFVAFWPLWGGTKTFSALTQASGWFYTNTIPYAVRQGLSLAGFSPDPAWLKYGFLVGFFVLYAYWLWRHALEKEQSAVGFFRRLGLVYLGFYLTITIPFGFHYLLWALPWLVLSRWPLERFLITLYAFTGLFSYFKRMNYLLLIAAAVYLTALWAHRSGIFPRSRRAAAS
ncbi:MAG: hypothetical protein HYT89_05065 [Candidatus Omnitrophica bacterium]|nr:hypothetical protein [Candidatus Omnitrophota bacterium]